MNTLNFPLKLNFPVHYKMIEDSIAWWDACSLPQWSTSERYFATQRQKHCMGSMRNYVQAPHWAEPTGEQTLPHLSRRWCNLGTDTLCVSICTTAPAPGQEADCFCASPASTACCRSSPDRLWWTHPTCLGLSPLASHWNVGQIKNLGPLCKDDQSSAFSIPKLACNVQLKLSVSNSAPPTQWHFLQKDEDVAHFFYLSFTTMYRQQHRIKKLFV